MRQELLVKKQKKKKEESVELWPSHEFAETKIRNLAVSYEKDGERIKPETVILVPLGSSSKC